MKKQFNFEIEHNGILWEVQSTVYYTETFEVDDYDHPSFHSVEVENFDIEEIIGWNIDLEEQVEFLGQVGVIKACEDYITDTFNIS